jgi:hypothetical protein
MLRQKIALIHNISYNIEVDVNGRAFLAAAAEV